MGPTVEGVDGQKPSDICFTARNTGCKDEYNECRDDQTDDEDVAQVK